MKHHVERAIILAAGVGERLRPVTLQTPKPLLRVHGRRLMDLLIQGLHQNGIREIYVVVGYLKDQFASLETEYPGVKLIENPYYACCNSIASLYCAREHLENAMILDSGQIIYDPAVLSPEFDRSGYNAVWTEEPTKERLLTVKDGVVTECSRTGGDRGWQLFGISRWTAEDGRKLRRHLEIEFEEKRNSQLCWDDLALFRYPADYALGIRMMCPDDVVEIDTLEELASIDGGYSALIESDESKLR